MIPPNKREAAAISTLAALTPDHDDSCISAVDVRALCARWDEIANRDAGPPRP